MTSGDDETKPAVIEGEIVEDGGALAPADGAGELLEEALGGLSQNSRKAYHGDWRRFGTWWGGRSAEQAVHDLVQLSAIEARRMVKRYREHMERDGLSPATVARAVRALNGVIKALHYIGLCPWVLGARAPKVRTYKDVRGPSEDSWRALLTSVSADESVAGVRDKAILRLLHDAVLRREEVCTLIYPEHLELGTRSRVWIANKGHGGERTKAPISTPAADAIRAWLEVRGEWSGPLFTRLTRGGRIPEDNPGLDGPAVYYLVSKRAKQANVPEPVAPHRLRHSGITTAAKRWDGPLAGLQRFSRHADPRTLMRYVDEVDDAEGEIAERVGQLDDSNNDSNST